MLHIVNKSPLERPALDACLRIAEPGAILLIEDAVYAAARGGKAAARLAEATKRHKVYVLLPDAEARAVADRLIEGVTTVDYGGFVDLVAEHENCQSWL
ncbi:MAG: sulfurtransferase complex subunit TusB [Betaproteobacteria bacterium]|jgi:tRNA 2-thiouridine synthesizing protein B|nr:sulfurtransferase complex subunit TusB [Betaproteobacteria bacterium]MBK6806892.1 sulfurtransferase complex subunit TusB [Betaproteobacteria bacterium]